MLKLRIFFTKKLYELKSVTLVQRAYRSEYKNKKRPSKATKLNLSRKFDRTGSLLNLPPQPKNERETRIEARLLSTGWRYSTYRKFSSRLVCQQIWRQFYQ